MAEKKQVVYPYIPNSTPSVRKEMLDYIGVKDVEDLLKGIPEEVRVKGELPLPAPISNEKDLYKYVLSMLKKNETTEDYACFLGGGVEKHYVPAICDEIVNKPEIYSTFMGFPFSDPGKDTIWWEYQSLMCDLTQTTMTSSFIAIDGPHAMWSSLLMCHRSTGKTEVLIPENVDPTFRMIADDTLRESMKFIDVKVEKDTGLMDIADLKSKFTKNTACVFFENPTYFGLIETRGKEICDLAHIKGASVVVYTRPISLGVLEPPAAYGADITCGDIQALGVHVQGGGGRGGFIACELNDKWQAVYPYLVQSRNHCELYPEQTVDATFNMDNTSYELREKAGDVVSTNSALWTNAAAVYLSIMGPEGMKNVGENISYKSNYARKKIGEIKGVHIPYADRPMFMEFVVDFNATGKSVEAINKALMDFQIFGGHSLKREFPEMGESALYCVTEENTKEEIDSLMNALKEVLK